MSCRMRLVFVLVIIVFLLAYFAMLCFSPAIDIRQPAYEQVPVSTSQVEDR